MYFDYSNFAGDEWFINDKLYVHGFCSAGEAGSGLQKMIRSDRGENIFEYTFEQNYTKVIFTKGRVEHFGIDCTGRWDDYTI